MIDELQQFLSDSEEGGGIKGLVFFLQIFLFFRPSQLLSVLVYLSLSLINQGLLSVEPLTYIRGRSLPNSFFVVDESQNLTPHEIKTILTRAGEGTKVVLTGDPYQIDNPYIDSTNNGLTYVVERFKGSHIAAHITLKQGERSELATMAAQKL